MRECQFVHAICCPFFMVLSDCVLFLHRKQMNDMKTLFHKGTAENLNVYTVGFSTRPVNGFASFPVESKSNLTSDGVVLLFNTLPGGSSRERQGGTLVHEIGHWLGLFHTFQNGCSPGDGVADTAPEAEPARGCPIGKKSCPGSDLPDPIRQCLFFVVPHYTASN